MSAVTGGERILLSGPPRNTKAVLPVAPPDDRAVAVRVDIAGEAAIHRAWLRPLGSGATELRLKLPGATPPGSYRGEVTLSGRPYAITIEVEPTLRVRISPPTVSITTEPGGRAEFAIVTMNNGNVAVEIPKSSAFDLDDADGQDRALGLALRAELLENEKRVDRYFEELRRSHGGQARVSVLDGAGPLVPGESRTLRCRVEIPMTTEPDRSFAGAWPIAGTSHVVSVTIQKPAPPENGRKPA
jgi:hypothetical protein